MTVNRRPAPRRGPRRSGVARRRGAGRRRAAVGVWRRHWTARLPSGPILLVLAATIAVVPLRAPADPGLEPGTSTEVVVAATRLESGAVVAPHDLEVRSLPIAALPPGTTGDPERVVGRQVIAPILPGEPVATARLAPDGLVGVAAATPPGRSAFAVPVDATQPRLEVDQRVDVYAIGALDPLAEPDPFDPPPTATSTTGDGAHRIAARAVVVAVDDDRVVVAVDPGEAAAVAGALLEAAVVLAVAGPDVDP